MKWAHPDSIREPRVYETPALTIELWARKHGTDSPGPVHGLLANRDQPSPEEIGDVDQGRSAQAHVGM